MKVRRIQVKKMLPVATPQCSEAAPRCNQFQTLYWLPRRTKKLEAKGFDPGKCSHSSSYVINGKPYCSGHAGQKALAVLEKGGK